MAWPSRRGGIERSRMSPLYYRRPSEHWDDERDFDRPRRFSRRSPSPLRSRYADTSSDLDFETFEQNRRLREFDDEYSERNYYSRSRTPSTFDDNENLDFEQFSTPEYKRGLLETPPKKRRNLLPLPKKALLDTPIGPSSISPPRSNPIFEKKGLLPHPKSQEILFTLGKHDKVPLLPTPPPKKEGLLPIPGSKKPLLPTPMSAAKSRDGLLPLPVLPPPTKPPPPHMLNGLHRAPLLEKPRQMRMRQPILERRRPPHLENKPYHRRPILRT